jgi:GNAT superfamily N-acetyltransferase
MTISVRRATQEDARRLAELRMNFQREMGEEAETDQHSMLMEATYRYFSEKLPNDGFVAWIAEAEGEIIGTSGLIFYQRPPSEHDLLGKEACILNMYTLPEWRGKGIASRLLQELLTYARQSGTRRIWLYATEDGKPVYEKAGFVAKKRKLLEMELTW